MTALNPEVKSPESQAQVKTDTPVSQTNPDPNLPQKKIENLDQNKQTENKEGESADDPNWKAFREARKKDRAEREEAIKRATEKEQEVAALKAAMEAAFSAKSSPSPQAYQQYYGMNEQPEENEEQRIERKVNELISKKEEQYRREQIEHEQREYPNRIKKDFPDFSQVCSQENLDYLDFHYPELSRPLQRLPEGYDKWHDTYHAVKKFLPNHSTAKKEAIRADMNSQKPRSISSSGPSPTGEKGRESWQEVEAKRAENYARMQRIMKGV